MRLGDRPEFATKPKPLTCPRDAAVAAAVARMSELNFGSVIVVDAERRVEGVVTERDVMKRLVNQGRDPTTTRLAPAATAAVTSSPTPYDVVTRGSRAVGGSRLASRSVGEDR